MSTQKEILNKTFINTINALQQKEASFKQALRDAYSNALLDIQKGIYGYYKTQGATYTGVYGQAGILYSEIANRIKELGGAVNDNLTTHLADIYKTSYQRTAWQTDIATPVSASINFYQIPVDQVRAVISTPWSGGMFSQKIFQITNEMAVDIQNEIAKGIILGEGMDDIAERVESVWGKSYEGYSWRAEMIARTETIRAREIGRMKFYNDNADLIKADIWITMEDACDECDALDGQEDTEEEPPLHPNCRCTKRAKLKSWDDLMQEGDDEEPTYQPFDKWLGEQEEE